MPDLDLGIWSPQKENDQPAFRLVGYPTTIMGLAFLPMESRIGIDVFSKATVVMVIAVDDVIVVIVVIVVIAVHDVLVMIIVIVVIVGVLMYLVVPMVLGRVMLVRSFVVVVSRMVLNLRETLIGRNTCDRDHQCNRQAIHESSSVHFYALSLLVVAGPIRFGEA